MTEQKITPCLWFDFNAEEAVAHYLSIFPNSRILSTTRYGDFAAGRKGAVMTILFEIDALWEKLAEGGEHVQCGWLTDKFGVSWQIVPRALPDLLGGGAERTDRVMRAVMGMEKLDVAEMKAAASAQ